MSQVLQEGVVILKNFLSPEEQTHLWSDIQLCAKDHKPTKARNAKSDFLKIISVNEKKKSKMPGLFSEFAERATLTASTLCNTIPPAYRIDYITSFKYSCGSGKLTGHCDKVTGWVVLFSLGNTANFWVKGKKMKSKHTFGMESGDVLIFNGGTEYGITVDKLELVNELPMTPKIFNMD